MRSNHQQIRFGHMTFALDSREDIPRAADSFLQAGVSVETGPHKHAVQQTFSHCACEPVRCGIEVACARRPSTAWLSSPGNRYRHAEQNLSGGY